MDFQLRHLRYFLAIAETGSFTRAAEKLGVSQPALSQRMQSLEKQVGFRLFVRSGRSIELTSGGIALLEPVRGLITYAQRLDRIVRDRSVRQPRTLLIGASVYSERTERVTLLSDFCSAYPAQQINMETGYTAGLYQSLLDCELDIAFIVGPVPDERFDYLPLRWYETEIVMPRNSDLANSGQVEPAMLRDRPVISFRRGRHPELYDKLIQPLVDEGAIPHNSPDQTFRGMLVYAQQHEMYLPTAFRALSEEELASHDMVARPLVVLGAISGLLVVRARGDNGVNNGFWRFAQSYSVPHVANAHT